MSAATMLRELTDTGIRLSVNGERLHVEARLGAVTPELRQRLTENKVELLATLKARACDETALQVRCIDACKGLPILPMALFASLTDGDRAAQYRGEEGPDVLRAYALAIADRLARDDETAAGEPLRSTCPIFRFRLAWNPDGWHYFLARPGTALADARTTLRRKHGDALLQTEAFRLAACSEGARA